MHFFKSLSILRRPLFALGGAISFAIPTLAQPPKVSDWDNFSDTWSATDGLGRALPMAQETGPPKADRTVGIFYFLWNEGNGPVQDISKMLAANPTNPAFGPVSSFHHWSEPLLGYYKQDDRYVVKKHLQQLTDAGVDVLLLDVTNALIYDTMRNCLISVLDEMKAKGQRVPKIAFLANTKSAITVQRLFDKVYKPGVGRPHWFYWLGKPLMLTPPDGLSEEVKSFFTLRHSWAFTHGRGNKWFGDGRDKWPWIDRHPQNPGWHESPDKPEQISVSVAGHPIEPLGKSFKDGKQPPDDQFRTAEGINFAAQWKRALEVDPQFIMITGWNEWIAQRFVDGRAKNMGNRTIEKGETYFVDLYSPEYSRDVEPMKGGYGDAYYYQMVANIRRYKGTRPLPEVKTVAIKIDGNFTDWADAVPVYRDTLGDPAKRQHPGWKGQPAFSNQTGRNDIATSKVSADGKMIYFYARTLEPLTPATDPNWMVLYIDADQNAKTGWLGYDFIVNRSNVRPELTTLEKHDGGGYKWKSPLDVSYRTVGSELEIAIPRVALGLGTAKLTFDFKWADNSTQAEDWSDFTLNGDAAPNDRYNYRAQLRGAP